MDMKVHSSITEETKKEQNPMKISVVYEKLAESEKVDLCGSCNGKGWKWSNLDFGDIPGDEERICCGACGGTGRVKTATVRADIIVPFDWDLKI